MAFARVEHSTVHVPCFTLAPAVSTTRQCADVMMYPPPTVCSFHLRNHTGCQIANKCRRNRTSNEAICTTVLLSQMRRSLGNYHMTSVVNNGARQSSLGLYVLVLKQYFKCVSYCKTFCNVCFYARLCFPLKFSGMQYSLFRSFNLVLVVTNAVVTPRKVTPVSLCLMLPLQLTA